MFTESSCTENMFTDEPDVANGSETEKEINDFGEFTLKLSKIESTSLNGRYSGLTSEINKLEAQGLRTKSAATSYHLDQRNPGCPPSKEASSFRPSTIRQNFVQTNKTVKAPLSGGRLQQKLTPVLQNSRSKTTNKYSEMQLQ